MKMIVTSDPTQNPGEPLNIRRRFCFAASALCQVDALLALLCPGIRKGEAL